MPVLSALPAAGSLQCILAITNATLRSAKMVMAVISNMTCKLLVHDRLGARSEPASGAPRYRRNIPEGKKPATEKIPEFPAR